MTRRGGSDSLHVCSLASDAPTWVRTAVVLCSFSRLAGPPRLHRTCPPSLRESESPVGATARFLLFLCTLEAQIGLRARLAGAFVDLASPQSALRLDRVPDPSLPGLVPVRSPRCTSRQSTDSHAACHRCGGVLLNRSCGASRSEVGARGEAARSLARSLECAELSPSFCLPFSASSTHAEMLANGLVLLALSTLSYAAPANHLTTRKSSSSASHGGAKARSALTADGFTSQKWIDAFDKAVSYVEGMTLEQKVRGGPLSPCSRLVSS